MKVCNPLLVINLFMVFTFSLLQANLPFITEDPDVIKYKSGEAYVGSWGTKDKKNFNATLPFFEIDYGVFKNAQLHAIVPLVINKETGKDSNYGPEMIELGLKYRFVSETRIVPQVGTFPLINLPTGDSKKGLGSGKAQFFLPLLLQKSWGEKGHEWTAYGGVGYWFNPGKWNKDYCFSGIVIQREITKYGWAGLEAFYQTKTEIDGHDSFGFNVGGGVKLQKNCQLICSFGKNTGIGQFLYCAAIYYTW